MKLFKRKQKFNPEEAYLKLIKDLNDQFGIVYDEIDAKGQAHDKLSADFYELRDELATNGVVRDLRRAEKDITKLKTAIRDIVQYVDFEMSKSKGKIREVVDGINEISYEVYSDQAHDQVTIMGKVAAIVEHLGIDISVKPEEVKIEPSSVVVKKAKKGKK